MDIHQLIKDKQKMLLEGGIISSAFEIKVLIGNILGLEPKNINFNTNINEQQICILDKMLNERLQGRPVDKIIGEKGFYKYNFVISDDVLSPRCDTEILVEKAVDLLKTQSNPTVLELGVGSGCIILSILADLPFVKGVGIDISEKALAIADINAENLQIEPNRLSLLQADWFEPQIDEMLQDYAYFDMIVSNPPYIASAEIANLDREVKNFDPLIALDGGSDGMKDYSQILGLAQKFLRPEGIILLEAGDSEQLRKIAEKGKIVGLSCLDILKDYSNQERCIILKK